MRSVGLWLAWLVEEQTSQELVASQHGRQWNFHWCSVLFLCSTLPSVKRGEREREQASKRAQVNQASDQTDLMTSAHGCS